MAFDPTTMGPDPALRPLPPAHVAALLAAARDHVVGELSAMGDELGQWRPAPGEWSVNECVGHLLEADRRGFAGRIRRMLAEDGVTEVGWNQLEVAAARRDWERPVAAVLEEFCAGRDDGIALVQGLSSDDLGRTALHATVGLVTVADLLNEWVFHDRNHIRQLLANTQARVWPVMGNTQRFTRPTT